MIEPLATILYENPVQASHPHAVSDSASSQATCTHKTWTKLVEWVFFFFFFFLIC